MCVCETRKRTRTKGDKSREGLNRKGLAEITLIKVRDETGRGKLLQRNSRLQRLITLLLD